MTGMVMGHCGVLLNVQVVERHWYERNKHIFPASRWEIFDPEKNYGDKYTIKG